MPGSRLGGAKHVPLAVEADRDHGDAHLVASAGSTVAPRIFACHPLAGDEVVHLTTSCSDRSFPPAMLMSTRLGAVDAISSKSGLLMAICVA